MSHKKPHLPEKICRACNRPFKWREDKQRGKQHETQIFHVVCRVIILADRSRR
ncbi:MAG: DUF2256 domain-containing protein [Planctomycetota bacterium]